MNVLVTGSLGQLGQALQFVAPVYTGLNFYFADANDGDITSEEKLAVLFAKVKPQYCINTAAYTAVDKAESEAESAALINEDGAAILAKVSKAHGTTLIHISTDFVFDGLKSSPYTEEDATNPTGVYGLTKRDGENRIKETLKEHYIIRTSWVYSDFGNNFLKTMLRVAKERDALNVVDDQRGTPTHALDLAHTLCSIIVANNNNAYGTYHYSNEGETTWYGFAKKIFEVYNVTIDLKPITSAQYPTPAKRPAYSVLDKSKIKRVFGLNIKTWEEALIQNSNT